MSNQNLFRCWWIGFFLFWSGVSFFPFYSTIHYIKQWGSMNLSLLNYLIHIVVIIFFLAALFLGIFLWTFTSIVIIWRMSKATGKKSMFKILEEKHGKRFILRKFLPFLILLIVISILKLSPLSWDIKRTLWIVVPLWLFFLLSLFSLFCPLMRESFLILKRIESQVQ